MNEIEKAKKLSEAAKEVQKRSEPVKQFRTYCENDCLLGRDVSKSARDLKWSQGKLAEAQKKLNSLK